MPYRPIKLLSDNKKTGVSINNPINEDHCTGATENCWNRCYGKCGHLNLPNSKRKQQFISNYLSGDDPSQLIYECKFYVFVRIDGGGELKDRHLPMILVVAEACPNTDFSGMTRRPSVAKAINYKLPNLSMIVSVDSSSSKSIWDYEGKMCFGPRLTTDEVPNDPRIVTVFPHHKSGKVIKSIPHHKKDCPAVWKKVSGCLECKRCWNWYKL